jgi:hypothetical protein
MMSYFMVISFLYFLCAIFIFFGIGAFVGYKPAPRFVSFTRVMRFISEFAFVAVLPGIGIAMTSDECGEHPFEIQSLTTTYTLWILFALSYILSRSAKEKLSPVLLLFVSTALVAGLIFCAAVCVHFIKLFPVIMFPGFNLLYVSPLFCIFFLLKEIRSINRLFISRMPEEDPALEGSAYYRNLVLRNLAVTSGFLTAPFLILLQSIFYLLGQKPDSLISQFTDSCGFLLSYSQACSCGGDHYLCSIAANGDKSLVKPTRLGLRQNRKILVNRQLLIANAFENWLEDHTPRFHKIVRRSYDAMNIPVNEWSKHRRFANILYVLMKPLEWFFLLWLYLADQKPETRIAKQYLPKKDFHEFIKTKTHEEYN